MQFEFLEGKFKSSETQEGPLSLKLVSHSLTGVSSDVSSDVSTVSSLEGPLVVPLGPGRGSQVA